MSRKKAHVAQARQLSLLGAVDSGGLVRDPKAPRAERMGVIERESWGALVPAAAEREAAQAQGTSDAAEVWSIKGERWCAAGGRAVPLLMGMDEAGRGPLAGPVSVAAVVLSPDQIASAPWAGRLDDSKRLSEKVRHALYEQITAEAPAWAIVHVHADQIDAVNILQATFQGMCMAVEAALGWPAQPWPRRPTQVRVVSHEASQRAARCWYEEALSSDEVGAPVGADMLVRDLEGVPQGSRVVGLIDGHKPFEVEGATASSCLRQQPVVKGDGLSMHIAAASILAKVSRDRVMACMDARWPLYGFAGHKGYPTAAHRDAIKAHGLCGVHRRSFRVR